MWYLRSVIGLWVTVLACRVMTAEPATTLDSRSIERELAAENAALRAGSGDLAEIARNRMALLRELVRANPAAVIEHALSVEEYAALPEELRTRVERPVSAVGTFSVRCVFPRPGESVHESLQRVVVIDGQEYPAVVYGRRESQLTKYDAPLQGVVVDGVFVMSESSIEEVPGAALPSDASVLRIGALKNGGVIGRIGGRYFRFSSSAELEAAEARMRSAEKAMGPDSASDFVALLDGTRIAADDTVHSWSTGPKKVLVVRVDFPDLEGDPKDRSDVVFTAATAAKLMDETIAPFFAENSYGKTSLATTVTPKLYRMPRRAAEYRTSDQSDALARDAYALAKVDFPETYDRIMFVFSAVFSYGGKGEIGGRHLWINGEFKPRTIAHELGHTYGVGHANLWKVTDHDPHSAGGRNAEYGDVFDVMGLVGPVPTAHFNPAFKQDFGWFGPGAIKEVTSGGTFRLYMFDTPNLRDGDLVAVCYRHSASRVDFISYRGAFAPDSPTQQSRIGEGAYVLRVLGTNILQTQLLDCTTPGTNEYDAALLPGATLVDGANGLTVRTLAVGGEGDRRYVDVELSIVDPRKMPTLSVDRIELGQPATISIATGISSLRTQLFVDGELVSETSQPNPSLSWQPDSLGQHVVLIKTFFPDQTTTTYSTTVTVGLPSAWEWVAPRPDGHMPVGIARCAGRWWMLSDYALRWSADGLTWTNAVLPTRARLKSIASDGTQIIVVSDAADQAGQLDKRLWRTTDGVTWVGMVSELDQEETVVFLNGTWVVLGQPHHLVSSTTGRDWSRKAALPALPLDQYPWWYYLLAYHAGRWVAGSSGGTIATSTNLVDWTAGSLGRPVFQCTGIAAVGNVWFTHAVDTATLRPLYLQSSDLTTWSPANPPFAADLGNIVTTINGEILVSTAAGLYRSGDGVNWTGVPSTHNVRWFAGGSGQLLAAGSSGGLLLGDNVANLRSLEGPRPSLTGLAEMPDGTLLVTTGGVDHTTGQPYSSVLRFENGTMVPTTATGAMNAITVGNGLQVAVGDAGRILTSGDGQVWTERRAVGSERLTAVCFTGDRFVAVGEGGTIVTSPDGVSWTSETSGSTARLSSVASDGANVVVVGDRGTVLVSSAVGRWQTVATGVEMINSVAWQPRVGFVAVGGGFVGHSTDGVTWTKQPSDLAKWWTALTATPLGIVAVQGATYGVTTDGRNFTTSTTEGGNAMSDERLFYARGTLYHLVNRIGLSRVALSTNQVPRFSSANEIFVRAGESVSFQVQAGGAVSQFSASGLPAGLSVNPGTGLITGRAEQPTTVTATLRATNVNGEGQQRLVIHVVPSAFMSSRLVNLSLRSGSTAGERIATAGFTIVGGRKKVLARLAGPALASLGLPGTLARPTMRLYQSETLLATAGAWSESLDQPMLRQASDCIGAFGFSPNSSDACAIWELAEGSYTIQAIGAADAPGLGLIELYDLDRGTGRYVNLSTRAQVGATDDKLLIQGFTVEGPSPKRFLIRGVGPTLTSYGVAGALADPVITVYDSARSPIATNDNWTEHRAEIEEANRQVYASGLGAGSRDAALIATLPPGGYTVIVTGVNRQTGVALAELYELP